LDWATFITNIRVDNDPWNEWGMQHPLPVGQRTWLVPATWMKNREKLGRATGFETYVTPDISHCLFERGMIIYHKPSNRCHVVIF
jgi:hypothetical protein